MGGPRDDPDVRFAIGLLERAESAPPSQAAADDFAEAFATLDAYLEFDPDDGAGVEFVNNLKYAYTRQVLARLREVDVADASTWFPWVALLFGPLREECERLRRTHPDLGRVYEDCLRVLGPQVAAAVRR